MTVIRVCVEILNEMLVQKVIKFVVYKSRKEKFIYTNKIQLLFLFLINNFFSCLSMLYSRDSDRSLEEKSKRQSRARTIDFDYILRHLNKLINQPLAINFSQNPTLIVIPQRSSHRFIIHIGLIFVHSPKF